MKRFIFWSTVLLALSGTMMGMAQDSNVVIFDGDGGQEYIYKKKHKYYVLKEDGIADVASDLFKKNKRWAKKILKKAVRNKNNAVDIFELVEGAYLEPFVGYTFKGEFYQFNLSSCIRQQNSLTAQFVSFSLSNLANIFYPPPIFTIINLCLL